MILQRTLLSPSLARLDKDINISACVKCPTLVACRNSIVVHRGNPEGEVMIVGEAPGVTEDETGFPFMGESGKYLDSMLERMGLTNDQLYITNAVKCRPPGNRKPTAKEQENCFGYLKKQMKYVKPKVVLLLGRTAAETFFEIKKVGMKEIINNLIYLQSFPGIAFLIYYHPSYLLRTQHKRGWIKKIEEELGKWIHSSLSASYALK